MWRDGDAKKPPALMPGASPALPLTAGTGQEGACSKESRIRDTTSMTTIRATVAPSRRRIPVYGPVAPSRLPPGRWAKRVLGAASRVAPRLPVRLAGPAPRARQDRLERCALDAAVPDVAELVGGDDGDGLPAAGAQLAGLGGTGFVAAAHGRQSATGP